MIHCQRNALFLQKLSSIWLIGACIQYCIHTAGSPVSMKPLQPLMCESATLLVVNTCSLRGSEVCGCTSVTRHDMITSTQVWRAQQHYNRGNALGTNKDTVTGCGGTTLDNFHCVNPKHSRMKKLIPATHRDMLLTSRSFFSYSSFM